MTVIEHLEELRRVLIISLIAWALATVIGFAISQWTLGILLGPVHKVIGGQKLIYPGPVDAFLLFFKIGIFTGFVHGLLTRGLARSSANAPIVTG